MNSLIIINQKETIEIPVVSKGSQLQIENIFTPGRLPQNFSFEKNMPSFESLISSPGYPKQLLNSVVYSKTLDKSLNHQGFLLFEYKSPFKIQL